ncbi:hypothetical protein HanPSC8_Chr02g0072891 [Helianthus annuus]|nr:hypothetical protein HanPSC8_Chr02g0072891 [Helianthus annuus]
MCMRNIKLSELIKCLIKTESLKPYLVMFQPWFSMENLLETYLRLFQVIRKKNQRKRLRNEEVMLVFVSCSESVHFCLQLRFRVI